MPLLLDILEYLKFGTFSVLLSFCPFVQFSRIFIFLEHMDVTVTQSWIHIAALQMQYLWEVTSPLWAVLDKIFFLFVESIGVTVVD